MNKQIYTKFEVDKIKDELEKLKIKLNIKEDIIQALLLEIKDLSKKN
ncbi:hypothetical protein KM792_11150 [Clostridium tyrobutyricum]|jgi:hypothetical protein|nr:hypothetical protein [Clostridium tyrobutyricum]MBV4427608.1 hypothetical protein [Clostridium tyrobutyricum]MBV4442655.1 hypothetical protein [Clostridium tyrobutyricum]MBV4450205.1 hypothetical protein [Clostridium tyrobutyricum]MEA5008767.1 hypothetical protein [Clostridium tyrobutyricum]